MRDNNTPESDPRLTTLLYIKSLTFNFADGIPLTTGIHGATLWVSYLHHPFVPGDREMPCEEEDVELLSATLLAPIFLTDCRGITVSIDGRCDILSILTDSQPVRYVAEVHSEHASDG